MCTQSIPTQSEVQSQNVLPVLIVGSGPCGLVAALTLQKKGVPFIIIEKASRSSICSNAGAGFELTPITIQILKQKLGIDLAQTLEIYDGYCVLDIEGKMLRQAILPTEHNMGTANRATLQKRLLEILFPSSEDEEGVLFCGSGVDSYQEFQGDSGERSGRVVVKLASGKEITGCVLLACDGIRSRCRAIMHGGNSTETNADPLNFCNTICYWGKVQVPEGSKLNSEFRKLRMIANDEGKQVECNPIILGAASWKTPASFFAGSSENGSIIYWVLFVSSKTAPESTNDLTRRGGGILTEVDKANLLSLGTKSNKDNNGILKRIEKNVFLEAVLKATPAKDITLAGIFDRKNLDLPYTSEKKLVALLGDAAHPQTPFLGQGVNMAIADAYIYADILANSLVDNKYSVPRALTLCDPNFRRKSNEQSIKEARFYCDVTHWSGFFASKFWGLAYKFASEKHLYSAIFGNTEYSNKDYWEYFESLHTKKKSSNKVSYKAKTSFFSFLMLNIKEQMQGYFRD